VNGPVAPDRRFERRLGRLLIGATYVAAALLLVGVVLLLVAGISPLSGGPALDPGRLIGEVLALEPAGFLWLGLIAVIATPVSRVVGAAIGFARTGEPLMTGIAVAILVVIALGVASALVTG
jgi:uncharacterized membrane protein